MFISNDPVNQSLTTIDLNDEEIKIIASVLKFSIAGCPIESISQEVEIDADKLDKIVSKMEKSLH